MSRSRQAEVAPCSVTVDVSFRLCRELDLPALEWMGLFRPHREIIRQTFAEQERGQALMLLGLINEFPIAQVWIDLSREGTERCPMLWAVRVFPPLQHSGIGTRIMLATEQIVQTRGAKYTQLGVEKHNVQARQFYTRLGYRAADRRGEEVEHSTAAPGHVQLELQIMRKRLGSPATAEGSASVIPRDARRPRSAAAAVLTTR